MSSEFPMENVQSHVYWNVTSESDNNEFKLYLVNSSMVVKRFKTPLGKDIREVHKRDRYWAQMEVQSVSAHMANEFNKWYVSGVHCFRE
jgi:hypothetical protein